MPFSPLDEFDIMIPVMREKFCEVPFVIDRNLKVGLVDQVAEGLRQAISAGRYKTGDVLPPVWKLAEVLGVSVRVPRYAIAKLVSEGYLASRQRIGAVVLGRDEMVWRGRVLFIVYAHNESSYYFNTVLGEFRKRMVAAGYQYSCVTVSARSDGGLDCSSLDLALRQKVDFAVTRIDSEPVVRRLTRGKVPFAVFGERCRAGIGEVGWIRYDLSAAIPEFAQECKASGVKNVEQVQFQTSGLDATAELKRCGVGAKVWRIKPSQGYSTLEAVERGSMNAFLARLKRGRSWLPAAFLFTDDFVAFGALTALLSCGVRIPQEVKCVTLASRGFGPVFPVSLTRMEMDPFGDGKRIAEWTLLFLRERKPPASISIGPTFVHGESL